MADTDTTKDTLKQTDEVNTRKRRLSKRERKNIKKKKVWVNETITYTKNQASTRQAAASEPTLEKYMANYEPAPITKHLSKQENESNDSLGKWFPKATVIKSSVCYSNDYLVSLKKKSKQSEDVQEPKASLVLFYQYVNPVWTPMKVSALSGYITNIVKSYRTNLGGRMRISSEGVNCTVSAASSASSTDAAFEAAQTLRHFAQDLRNFDPDSFSDTDFKYIDNLTADRHFKETKILPVKELVFYGIREDGGANHEDIKTEGEVSHVLPKNAKGGIHLDAHEYHDMLKTKNTVVIDVRNHYEAAIGRFDGQMESNADDADGGNGERNSGAQYIDPKMRKSTDFTSWLEEPETKQKLEGKTVMMFCTGGIRCERASAYLNAKMGSDVQGVYQLKGGIERYLQAFPDGGFWRGKNFVFDKREAIGAGNVNGDGGVIKKEVGKKESADKPLTWGTECAKCKKPWDRYIGKRHCYTCGVPILLCDECLSQSATRRKNKKKKGGNQNTKAEETKQSTDSAISNNDNTHTIRCPLCVEEGITVPAGQVEYTNNGVRGRTSSFSEGDQVSSTPTKNHDLAHKKAAKSVLKWGGGHATEKKEKRRYARKPCHFGADCVRKDCFFYHPERENNSKNK